MNTDTLFGYTKIICSQKLCGREREKENHVLLHDVSPDSLKLGTASKVQEYLFRFLTVTSRWKKTEMHKCNSVMHF